MIRFTCDNCGCAIKVDDAAAGKRGKCPSCGQALTVPIQPENIQARPARASATGSSHAMPNPPPLPAPRDPTRLSESHIDRDQHVVPAVVISASPAKQGVGSSPFQHGYVSSQPQFHCPFCQSTCRPRQQSKVSTAGWVLFVLMLLFLCWPLCWLGLLIKDEYYVCGACGMKLG